MNSDSSTRTPRQRPKAASSTNKRRASDAKGLSSAGVREPMPTTVPKSGGTPGTAPHRGSSANRKARDVTKWKLSEADAGSQRPKATSPGAKVSAAAGELPRRSSARSVGPIASTAESIGALSQLAMEASESTLAAVAQPL